MADKKEVMVVDDEKDIRDTVKNILESEDYKVILAEDGDDALKKLKDNKPDLILMDIMMPGTPVREVIKKIKDINIIFVSVVKTSEAEKENLFKQDNVKGFVQKPFDTDYLIEKVKDALGE